MLLDHNMTDMAADIETQRAARHGAYALVGLSETAPACPFCRLTPHVKMCDPQRAAMAQTYTTSMTGAGYIGLYRDGAEMSRAETAAEMNRHAQTITELRAEIQRVNDRLGRLRIDVDDGRQHAGALIKAYQHEHAAVDTYEATRGTERWGFAGLALEEAEIATARCLAAARAWLRQKA